MSDAFIRWYRESAITSVFSEQTELFERHGIHLFHPALGTALVLDVEGNDVPVGREELDRLLGLRIASINVNWWLSADTNLVDEYSYEPLGCAIQTFWLDGLDEEEVQTVEAALMAAVVELPVPTRALIIDRCGDSEPDEWDSVVLYEGRTVARLSEGVTVIAQDQVAARLLRASPGLIRQETRIGLSRLALHRRA
ncbi:hypothetical protein AB0K09_13865 [Streptomyces sp. NPDC049577]|uniref:hypothetical protein n=1 Tax=Streptomyces sp. NPDC049577 TaxID=3155153 RepID=UPI003419FCF9